MTLDVSKAVQTNEKVSPSFLTSNVTEGDKKIIEGYALKFNQRSKKLGNFYEVIGAQALQGVDLSDVKALVDHDFSKVLGRTKAQTLKLSIDAIGLKFLVEVPNTSYANDLYESVQRGDITECSFGFDVNEADRSAQTVTRLADGIYLRTVNKIERLDEISIVANPAYSSTEATIKRNFDTAVRAFETQKLKIELELLTL